MAALFAAGTACPLSSLFITTEVAQGYHLLPGLMWAVALAYLLRPRPGLILGQAASSAESPAHRGRFHTAALRRAKVSSAMHETADLVSFLQDVPLDKIRPKVAGSRQELYPVVDAEGRYLGAFKWTSVDPAPPESTAGSLAAKFPPLRDNLDLERALEGLTAQRVDVLPVVDAQGRWRGLLNRRDLFAAVSK
jgi:CBS-domain-containing membrane protein